MTTQKKAKILFSFLTTIVLFSTPFLNCAKAAIQKNEIPLDSEVDIQYSNWKNFKNTVQQEDTLWYFRGKSQIITGILALVAGLAGDAQTERPLERGVYALFQSIGIASIGFGTYDLYVGSEDRRLYHLLESATGLSEAQRDELLKTHYRIDRIYQKREKQVKFVTFALLSLSQFYNANRVETESVKNSLRFLGAINLIAAVSFSF